MAALSRRALTALLIAALSVCGAVAPVDEMPSMETLERDSRSRVVMGGFTVFLYAPDQRVSFSPDTTCFSDEGVRVFAGHWTLVATSAGETVSLRVLGEDRFVERRLYDGLRVLDAGDRRLLALASYLSCSGDKARLFDVDRAGAIVDLPIQYAGKERDWLPTSFAPGLEGKRPWNVFCDYNNVDALAACVAVAFDGARLVERDAWVSKSDVTTWSRPDDEGRVRWLAYRLLVSLANARYDEAAALYQGSRSDLERFCECLGGRRCPLFGVSSIRRRGDMYEVTAQPFDLDRAADIELDVARDRDGFRVTRLPACVPAS